MESPAPLPAFEDLPLEDQAARVLFYREHGFTSVRGLAAAMELPVSQCETLLCRGLSTLVARGYPPALLCATFALTPAQLSRAATAPTFSETFRPLGEWRWHRVDLPDEPESAEGWLAQAAAQAELSDSAA